MEVLQLGLRRQASSLNLPSGGGGMPAGSPQQVAINNTNKSGASKMVLNTSSFECNDYHNDR